MERRSYPAGSPYSAEQLKGAGTADSFYLLDMVSSKVLDNMIKGIQEMIQGKSDSGRCAGSCPEDLGRGAGSEIALFVSSTFGNFTECGHTF